METQIGKVKWFNRTKGYGFIEPDNGSKDVFIHVSEIKKQGISDPKEDQKISYKTEDNKGKLSAVDIKIID
jgi:CspA family cold shock protein